MEIVFFGFFLLFTLKVGSHQEIYNFLLANSRAEGWCLLFTRRIQQAMTEV